MQGARVGQAGDFFNLQWATLAALLGVQQGRHIQPVSPAALGNLFIASDDARNYTLLGRSCRTPPRRGHANLTPHTGSKRTKQTVAWKISHAAGTRMVA